MASSILLGFRKSSNSYTVNHEIHDDKTTSTSAITSSNVDDNFLLKSITNDYSKSAKNSLVNDNNQRLSSSITTTYASSTSSYNCSEHQSSDDSDDSSLDQTISVVANKKINNKLVQQSHSNDDLSKSNLGFILDENLDKQTTFPKTAMPLNNNVRKNNDETSHSANKHLKLIKSLSANSNGALAVDNCFVSLSVNGKKCLVMVNSEYLAYEQELTSSNKSMNTDQHGHPINNDRVTIKISDILAVWICVCHQNVSPSTRLKFSSSSSISLCNCIASDSSFAVSSGGVGKSFPFPSGQTKTKLINPSKKEPPFTVKIYYGLQHQMKTSKINGYKLEMLTLSTSNEQNNSTNDDLSAIIHHQTQLLTEIAYKIRQTLELFERPKRLLLFVNPFGGCKKGIKIFEQKVKPVLELSRVEYDYIITERADQAKEMILNTATDLSTYDGIICVGGDGMFGEVLNGVLIRTQQENNVNYGFIDASIKKPSLKLGIVPAGSTDAIVYATCGHKCPINSIISIVLGRTINIDVGAVHHRDEEKLIRYTASFMGYGFMGDTILESERMRWLGPKRYDLAGVKKFFKHRLYSGEIKLCLEPSDGSPEHYNPCGINCSTCYNAGIKSREKLNADDSPACISIRGRFLAINSAIISGRCRMSKYGMSPMAHIGNGCVDLILVSKCTRFEYLRYLFNVAFHRKSPFDFNFIDAYRVREFEFNPIIEPHKRNGYAFEKPVDCDFFDAFEYEANNNDDGVGQSTTTTIGSSQIATATNNPKSSGSVPDEKPTTRKNKINNKKYKQRKGCSLTSSVWNCDGEIVNEPAIHVKIHCQLVKLYAPGFDAGPLLAKTIRN